MVRSGVTTLTRGVSRLVGVEATERAAANYAQVVRYAMRLYAAGDSSLSAAAARRVASSVCYVLGLGAVSEDERIERLASVSDPLALWRACLEVGERRLDHVLDLHREAVLAMPLLENVSMRDTLTSIGCLRQSYDLRFSAHEVPCDIQYQLSVSVREALLGLDYIEAWLNQFITEARWLARFDESSCECMLDLVCPDWRGLHVNLVDLLRPHEAKLCPASPPVQ